MMEEISDKALLQADDEEKAFRVLYDRYWDALFRKATGRLGNEADAQDVVQEVFISCWRNRGRIVTIDSISPYLFTALKYAIIKLIYRRAKKGIYFPLFIEELARTELTTEEFLEFRELRSILEVNIAKLPEKMRVIYRLSREENLPVAEIARRMEVSEQTVKNTLSRAIKRLRNALDQANFLLFFLL